MDLSSIQPFLNWLAAHPQWVALAVMLIAFMESLAIAGIVVPGVLLLFGASAVAGGGILSVWATLASALLGAVLGDGISFFLGKYSQQHIRELWPFRNYPQWLNNGERFFFRHGGKSVIMGRFVGPIRPVLPLVAGMLNMPTLRFISINVLSAIAWAPFYVLPGYVFGASLQRGISLPSGLGRLGIVLLVVTLLSFVFIRLTHWQLHPDSAVYRALNTWSRRQRNARLFWIWLLERRGPHRAFPLVSMLLFIASLLAFVLITLLAKNSTFMADWNNRVANYFTALQHPWLDSLFIHIGHLGDTPCLLGISVFFVAWLYLKRHSAAASHLLSAMLGSLLLVNSLQPLLAIAGPASAGDSTGGFSFPAGEISNITVLSGLTAAFIAQEVPHRMRGWVYTGTLGPIMLIALAELYQGHYWLSDTLGGLLLGLALCGLARVSFSRYNRHPITVDASLWIGGLLTAFSIVLYIGWR